MFNDSSDFRHERLERLIWIDGNFVNFLGLALLMSYSKEKICGRLDILHFP